MFLLLKNRSENDSKDIVPLHHCRYICGVVFPVLIAFGVGLNCGEMAEFRIACYTLKNKGSLSVFMVT